MTQWKMCRLLRDNWFWLLAAVLVVVSVVLGVWGLVCTPVGKCPRDVWDILYNLVCLFQVESSNLPDRVPPQLAIARLTAPLAAGLVLVKALLVLFKKQVELGRLKWRRNHVVICGLGRKGLEFARNYRNKGLRVVVVDLAEGTEEVESCRQMGITLLEGDGRTRSMLRRARVSHAARLILTCGDDAVNLEIAMAAHEIVQAHRPQDMEALECHVHVADRALCEQFRRHKLFSRAEQDNPFALRLLNVYEMTAERLLEQYPPDREGGGREDLREARLVVLGCGQMGESLILQAARIGHFANCRPVRITVVDLEARERERQLLRRYPGLANCCGLEFVEGGVEHPDVMARVFSIMRDKGGITTVAVCFDSDSHSLLCALNLATSFYDAQDGGKKGAVDTPVLVRLVEEAGLKAFNSALVKKSGEGWERLLHPFGALGDICNPETLENDSVYGMAKQVHEGYRNYRFSLGDKEGDDPSLRPWDLLRPDLQDSNRHQACHMPVKLRAVGCEAVPEASPRPLAQFTDGEVECLARMEHNRWNAERWLAGWRLGSPKDTANKVSPWLIPWDDLPPNIREYDLEAVRMIPDVLRVVGQRLARVGD